MLGSSSHWRQRLWRVFVCTMLMALPLSAAAQNITGQITGRVTDSSGGTLPGVTVTVVNENTGLSVTRVTDATGVYVFTNLPVGSYSVAAELEGFRKVQRTGFELGADGRVSADFRLDGRRAAGVGRSHGGHRRDRQPHERRGRAHDRLAADQGSRVQRPQLSRAGVADSRRGRDRLRSAGAGDQPQRHRPVDQRQPRQHQQPDGRRRLEPRLGLERQPGQQRQPDVHRSGQDPDLELLGRARPQQRRRRSTSSPAAAPIASAVPRATTCATRPSTSPTSSPPATPPATAPSPSSSSATSRRASAVRSSRTSCSSSAASSTAPSTASPRPARQTMPTSAELSGDFAFRLRGTDGIVGTADDGVLRDPASNTPFSGNRIPANRITTDGRAIANTYSRMIELASEYADSTTAQQRDLPALQPVRTAAGHHPHRLAGDGQAAHLRPLPARRVRPARSLRRLLRRAAADGADQPVASRHELPRRPHLGARAQPDQRSQGQRVVERAAHQPAGRHLAARHLRLPVPRALSTAGSSPTASRPCAWPAFANFIGPSFALLSPTTDITFQNTLT